MKILLIISCLFLSISVAATVIADEKATEKFNILPMMNIIIWIVFKITTRVMFVGAVITTVLKLFDIHWLWCILISAFTVVILAFLHSIIAGLMRNIDIYGIKIKSFNSFTGKYERENNYFVGPIILFIIGLILFIIGLVV